MKFRNVISLLVLLSSTVVCALEDSHVWDWRAAHGLPFHWDNIETSSRQWIAGERPEYDRHRRLHVIELNAGKHSVVAVPAGQWLQLMSLDGTVDSTDVTLARSADGRLFVPEQIRSGTDQHTLVTTELHGQMGWVRIENPADRGQPLRLALFVSRLPAPGQVEGYPQELGIEEGAAAVRLGDRPGRQTYWHVQANRDAVLSVRGPQRIKLRSRLIMAKHTRSGEETYRIEARLVNGAYQIVELETDVERHSPVQIDACTLPVGQVRHGYIDIPSGVHQLSLRTSRDLYLQLLASRGADDYLFAGNAAAPPLEKATSAGSPSLWTLPDGDLQRLFTSSTGIPESERLAQRLARDNRWQAANLMAAQGLAGPPEYSFEALSRFRLAKRRAGTLQYFVNLLPNVVAGSFRQRTFSFQRLALAEKVEPELIWTRQLVALAGNAASGEFVQTPVERLRGLVYSLPERDHDSLLRLTVSAQADGNTAVLYFQFDEGPVHSVLLANEAQAGRNAVLRPDRATLASAALADTENPVYPDSVSLPWGEIQLPARVKNIRVWAGRQDTWTALQLQKSRSYRPGEGAYLAAVDAVGREKALARFIARLNESPRGDLDYVNTSHSAAGAELDNLWLPLMRYLNVQARYFSSSTDSMPFDDRTISVDRAVSENYQQRAEQAEQLGEWVLAVEYWSQALRGLHDSTRQALQLRRAIALRTAGETALARRELWQLYRDSSDSAVQIGALEALLGTENYVQDSERGIRILSAALLVRPGSELLERLLPLLVAAGRFDEALQIALLLPAKPGVTQVLLVAARSESWWTVFNRAWSRLPEGEQRHYWLAWPFVAAGNYSAALERWSDAGDPGKVESMRLREALAIRHTFYETNTDERYRALLKWEQWQADSLQRPVWRPAPESVRVSAGSATVAIPQLGVNQRHYLATASQGVELELYGPTRLRISLRPLYPKEQLAPADDWLVVSMNGRQQYYAVNGNSPDPERYIVENDRLQVGQRDQFVIDIPPGYQHLRLALSDHDALLGVERANPAVLSELLPVLTPENAALLLAGTDRSSVLPADKIEWPVQLAEACEVNAVKVSIPAASGIASAPDTALFGKLSELRDASKYNGSGDPVQELAALVWQAEQEPERLGEIAAITWDVYNASPEDEGTQALMQRIQRRMSWKPVTNLWQRAGVRDITLNKSSPEHPSARVRHAVLPALHDEEERLSGWSALVFSLEQPYPVEFAFDFTLEGLLEPPTAEIGVELTIDNEQARLFRLGPQHINAGFRKTIASGAHSVRIRLLDPVARHSVRVRVSERQEDDNWVLRALRPAQRSYNVSTTTEPLVLYTRGPGLIRIDEWRDDHITYRYRTVGSGWQKLSFDVPFGQEEALYRVFQWVADSPEPGLPVRLAKSRLPVLPAAPVSMRYPVADVPVLANQLSLSGQEDGTLSGTLELASRRNLDEDRDINTDAERFVELRAMHRKYLAHWPAYHRFDALTRIRQDGGPTLGLREFLSFQPDWHDVELNLNGSFYLQRPGGEAGTEWLGDLRGQLLQRRDITARSYHRPSVRLFRRWMSLDDDLDDDPERVDQDVFTSYKKQHRQGLALGDELFYRPWSDMVSWLGVNVTSNDDFNVIDPDHVRGRFGARVLWRDWDFGAEYTATRYFEDDDRNSNQTRQRLRLEAQMWRWSTPRNGLQMRLRFDHDRSSNDNSIWLGLTWHRANGRLFRDFRPGDLNFRGLRERMTNERLFRKDSGGQS